MGTASGAGEKAAYPYRVFISYAHADRQIVRRLVSILSSAGLDPMWDDDLTPGNALPAQIQNFIRNSHVFLPVFTPASAERPWLHQELGFAVALGKPILPVALGSLPVGIVSDILAVTLEDDLSDAPAKLSAGVVRSLMAPLQEDPVTYQCTEDNVRRALLLGQYAESVLAIQRCGRVRQMASLTSFHLPDRGPADPIWKKYFPATPDDCQLFDALRKERAGLHVHAGKCGCSLILDSTDRLRPIYKKHGPASVLARINGILAFLSDPTVEDVVVAINDDEERKVSVTIVGDWFSSEAVSSGEKRILRESVFTRCASKVRQQIEDFDHRLHDLMALRGWSPESSRANAIAYLKACVAANSWD